MTNGATDNWTYSRPVNGTDWARLADWEVDGVRYNHTATNWFNLSMNKNSGTSGTSVWMNMNNKFFLGNASGSNGFKDFAVM